jgi:hypothetical protein
MSCSFAIQESFALDLFMIEESNYPSEPVESTLKRIWNAIN